MTSSILRTAATFAVAGVLVAGLVPPAAAATTPGGGAAPPGPVQLERLDRGLIAATTSAGIHLSWRLLGTEVTGGGDSGMSGPDFRVFRDGSLIATVTDSTNFLDPDGTTSSRYEVAPAVGTHEVGPRAAVTPWASNFTEIPIQKPADGVTPAGQGFTYRANDMSIGDVDGDGALEYVVKWDPTNQKDNSQVGYTGTVYVDTYEADGTLLNRLDLGPNIRAGAHYTQFLVYDFDGDGRSEIMLRTAPGTRSITYADGQPVAESYITMPQADIDAGYTHSDDYRLSSADYYEHMVAVFRDWGSREEVVSGQWPATLEEAFGIEQRYVYPLSDADARSMVDYFMDVYAPSRSSNNKLRQFEGFVLSGPEYLSVFDGRSGAELQTIPYEPGREDDGLLWGDYAASRIEPGNRVDRFLAGVSYLDGQHPSAIFSRGYYSRTVIVTYDWDGQNLTKRWVADSGHAPTTNPFRTGTCCGTSEEYGLLVGQGFHSLSTGDVDADGKQEIVFGSATLDDDGSLMYVSSDVTPPTSPTPGVDQTYGHGDALHVTDIDPARPGLEIFTVHENTRAPYGAVLRRAEDGEAIFGQWAGRDNGRGMVGDVRTDSPGLEVWSPLGLYSAAGQRLGSDIPGTNQSIRWAADMTTQTVRNSGDIPPIIHDWTRGTLLDGQGTLTNNSTKGNPSLVADVFGDWREELLVRTTDSSAIRIYVSTEVTDRKLYTLLHDAQYRADVARQQTSYNQPAYTSFYLASDIDWSVVPVPRMQVPGSAAALVDVFTEYLAQRGLTVPGAIVEKVKSAQRHLIAHQPDRAADALRQLVKLVNQLEKPRLLNSQDAAFLKYQAEVTVLHLG